MRAALRKACYFYADDLTLVKEVKREERATLARRELDTVGLPLFGRGSPHRIEKRLQNGSRFLLGIISTVETGGGVLRPSSSSTNSALHFYFFYTIMLATSSTITLQTASNTI